MQTLTDCLLILGLTSCKSLEVLKSAYRREMHRWHPDRFQNNPSMIPTANARARLINEANEFLSRNIESGSHRAFKTAQRYTPGKSRRNQKKKSGSRTPFYPGFPDPEVEEIFVNSTNIASAGYNSAKSLFYLKFRDRSIYCYFDVPEEVFTRFTQADSHGRFANHHVFNCYRSERCS